jgi:methionine-rich copper-binding protein CopC
MTSPNRSLTGHLLACAALSAAGAMLISAPAQASITISDSISQSVTTLVGSISDSVKQTSDSSSRRNKVQAGDYKVMEVVAEAQERPGMARVKLQAVATQAGADGEFFLYLPRQAVDTGRLAVGGVVTASERPYGVEFASAATKQAFFLVLEDTWHRELSTKQVVL